MEFNARFQPSSILDINDLHYCGFCSQASLSSQVHSNQSCILDGLNLITSSNSNTISLNFGFYQCFLKNCFAKTSDPQEFCSHLSGHGISIDQAESTSSLYKCDKCSYKTTQQRYLDNHKETCTTIKQEMIKPPTTSNGCLLAPKSITSVVQTNCAGIQFSNENMINLDLQYCTRCTFKTRNTLLLRLHQRFCVRNNIYFGRTLKRKTVQIILIRSLSQNLQTEPKKFNCDLCSFSSPSNASLRTHKVDFHCKPIVSIGREKLANTSGKQFLCPNCPYKPIFAKSRSMMVAHRKLCGKENEKKLYRCSSCHYLTREKYNLKRHHVQTTCVGKLITVHDTFKSSDSQQSCPRILKCSFCPYKARLSIMVKHHEKRCSSAIFMNFRCSRCFDVLTTRENLDRHVMNCKLDPKSKHTTTTLRNEELHCKNCLYRTKSKFLMSNHTRLCMVPTIKSYRCAKCNHLSRRKQYLDLHIKVCQRRNAKVKTLSCPKCCYCAPNPASLRIHKVVCQDSGSQSRRCLRCNFIAKSTHGYRLHRNRCKISVKLDLSNKIEKRGSPKHIKCSKCSRMVDQPIYYRYHRDRCRNTLFDAYRCPNDVCLFIGSGDLSLKRHLDMTNHKKSTEILDKNRCTLCPFVSSNSLKMEKHSVLCNLRKEGNKEVASCVHPGCFFLAKNKGGMITHSRTIHHENDCKLPSKSVTDKRKSVLMKNRSYQMHDKQFSCKSCPYSASDYGMVMSHETLCTKRQNGVGGIFACKYPNCYFLSKSIAGYKSHLSRMHLTSVGKKDLMKENRDIPQEQSKALINCTVKKQFGKRPLFNCDTCLYSCRNQASLPTHKELCSRKIKGDKSIKECEYPGCYSLFSTMMSLKVHARKFRHQNTNRDILKPFTEAEDTSDVEESCGKSQDVTTNEHVEVAGSNICGEPPSDPVLPEDSHVIEDYHTCEQCSFKCLASDSEQIELHKVNCRIQLFGVLSLAPSHIIKEVNDGTSFDERNDVKNDIVNGIPGKTDDYEIDATEQSESSVLDLENNVNIKPQLELVASTTDLSGQLCFNSPDDMFLTESVLPASIVTCTPEPEISSVLLKDEPLKEYDIFSSSDVDGPSFCLDADYFV